MDRHAGLLAAIKDLYRRAREHSLTADDIIPLAEVAVSNNENYLERIYFNRSEYDCRFMEFGKIYKIFGGFTSGQVVLDVGAHWGYSAVAMRHQGCNARVFSIEAMPLNVPPLMRLKSIDNGMYDFCNAAASDDAGTIRLYIPVINGWANTGLATTGGALRDDFAHLLAKMADVHEPRDGAIDKIGLAIANVPALPIDKIVDRAVGKLGSIAAIKMDIEGHEGPALRGARCLLADQKPLLMVEGANRNPTVVAEMTGHGYFHCEYHDGRLVPHKGQSLQNDGFWLHPDKIADYQGLGIFDARGISGEDASVPLAPNAPLW